MAAKFKFVFVAMGQGDCCMVRCPDGQVIVVDCGSLENKLASPQSFTRAQQLLRSVKWAGGQGNKIAALILTHPDGDHHNKVFHLCSEREWIEDSSPFDDGGPRIAKGTKFARVKIDKIYFSDAELGKTKLGKNKMPLANYGGREARTTFGLSDYIAHDSFSTEEIYEITINAENSFYNKWKKPFQTIDTLDHEFPLANHRRRVLDGTTEGVPWKVNIIAGNVKRLKAIDSASPENAKSLITLFEIGNQSALLTGDATYSTEQFLRDTHPAVLAAANLVQVPHHGSSYASAKATIDSLTALKHAVVSVSFMEHKHLHPWYDGVLEHWIERLPGENADPDHHVDYWTKVAEVGFTGNYDHFYQLWTTNGTDFSRVFGDRYGFYWLDPPQDRVFAYKYNGKNDTTRYLFREWDSQRLRMTSMATQVYKLSTAGVSWVPLKPPK